VQADHLSVVALEGRVEAVLEVIFGALFHRLLLRSGPLDAAYASFVARNR